MSLRPLHARTPAVRRFALLGAAALLLSPAAQAQEHQHGTPTHDHSGHAAGHDAAGHAGHATPAPDAGAHATPGLISISPDTTRRSAADMERIYWERINGARTRFVEADVHFMTGMIGHHAQALVMSAMAPTHGASPEVQRLAARIDNAQQDEIETMQAWLRNRNQPVPEVHIADTTLMIHGGGDHGAMHHNMPGMLTEAQMQQLDAARGGAFDRLFLSFMIQHHSGAVTMVDELFSTDGAGQDEEAFKLASDVQVDQRTEIARMQLMLDALPAAP